MKAVAVACLCLLVLGCASFAFLSQTDVKQIEQIVAKYVSQWGQYAYMEVKLLDDKTGHVIFIWADGERNFKHGLMLAFFDGEWFVMDER